MTERSDSSGFDAARWQRVGQAFDAALDLDPLARKNYLQTLSDTDSEIAEDVAKMLERADATTPSALESAKVQPAAESKSNVREPRTSFITDSSRNRAQQDVGFDGLLQRALRADRSATRTARYAGEMCGAWRLDRPIGEGGMGEVWLASRADGLYTANVAVKFLRSETNSSAFEARFSQERALLARLNHPGIARLIDAGRKFGAPFLVLEYVEGRPLLEYIAEHAPTVDQRIALFQQIVEAVSYAHSQLIVHRDIKPSNVMVTASGQVKLLDFGVAGLLDRDDNDATTESPATRLSGRGLTIEYAAPEQIAGGRTGVASDLYSLGALGFHMIAGRRPHLPERAGRAAQEHAVLHEDAPKLSDAVKLALMPDARSDRAIPQDHQKVGGDLNAIFAHALQRDPVNRYRTADELVADLRRYLQRRPISTRRTERAYRARLWMARNWLPVSLVAFSIVLLSGGLMGTLFQYQRAKQETARLQKTTNFLAELLRSADPDLNGGKTPDVIDILERAASEARIRFADDAATEYELTDIIATTYRSLSRDSDALPLATRAVELAAKQFGATSLQALRAQQALAAVQYWNNDFASARATFAPIKDDLLKRLPAESMEAFVALQFDAETRCAIYEVTEAEKIFRALETHAALAKLDESNARWIKADHEGRLASCITRRGNWQTAYELMRTHLPTYENPPPPFIKQALYHREFLLSVQTVLGITTGLETTAQALIERWQTLAGDKSDRIDRLLSILANHYQFRGAAKKSAETFERLIARGAEKPGLDPIEQVNLELGLLETQALFALESKESVLTRVEKLMASLAASGQRSAPRFRQHFLRAAIIALTYTDVARAEKFVALANQLGLDQAPSSAIRMLQVKSQLARATGQHNVARELLNQRVASFDARGEKRSLRRALLTLSRAYETWLAGERDRAKLTAELDAALAAAPANLPSDELFFIQLRWLRAVFEQGENSTQATKARSEMAVYFGRRSSDFPALAAGLFFL